jgi:hypothetical protein
MDATLTTDETRELISQESFISRNMESFLKVGAALAVIRDKKLYRGTHPTFADYVGERWNMSRAQAYRLLNLNEVVQDLSPTGDIPNERQARELSKVEPEQRAEVWQDAKEETGNKPTAKAVKEAVERRKPAERREEKPRKPSPPKPKESSLEVNMLKELIENEQDKITAFRWLWDSMEPWQRARLQELIELWSEPVTQ